jgi:hypothetical protein
MKICLFESPISAAGAKKAPEREPKTAKSFNLYLPEWFCVPSEIAYASDLLQTH